MIRDVLTRAERRQQWIRHFEQKWAAMTPEQRDAEMMRAMDEALDARQCVTKQDLRLKGIPATDIDRRWSVLLPLVIKARPHSLPVMGTTS